MRNIDVMLARPGIYLVMATGGSGLVEVDDAGRAFQLELASGEYAHDGELPAGRWNMAAIVAIHGPFQRAVARVEH